MTMFKYFSHQLPGRIFIDKYLVLVLARYVDVYTIITSMILGYFLLFMPFSLDMILVSFILVIPAIKEGIAQHGCGRFIGALK